MEFTVKRHEAIVAVIELSKYLRRQLTIRYDTICNYLTYAQQLGASQPSCYPAYSTTRIQN